eukprot:11447578-Alexandrium_andersonii.AAC.1
MPLSEPLQLRAGSELPRCPSCPSAPSSRSASRGQPRKPREQDARSLEGTGPQSLWELELRGGGC